MGKKGLNAYVRELMQDHDLDFVGLQETMKSTYFDAFFRRIDPLHQFSWNWIPSKGKSGDILGGIRTSKFELLNFSQGDFFLRIKVRDKKSLLEFHLVCVYGPAQDDGKEDFLQELAVVCSNQSLPLMIGGDFNIMRFSTEKNKNLKNSKWIDMFNAVINTHGPEIWILVGGNLPGLMVRRILL